MKKKDKLEELQEQRKLLQSIVPTREQLEQQRTLLIQQHADIERRLYNVEGALELIRLQEAEKEKNKEAEKEKNNPDAV